MIRNAFCQTNRLFNLLERAEKEICFSMANGTFKMKMDIDRHGPDLCPTAVKILSHLIYIYIFINSTKPRVFYIFFVTIAKKIHIRMNSF